MNLNAREPSAEPAPARSIICNIEAWCACQVTELGLHVLFFMFKPTLQGFFAVQKIILVDKISF